MYGKKAPQLQEKNERGHAYAVSTFAYLHQSPEIPLKEILLQFFPTLPDMRVNFRVYFMYPMKIAGASEPTFFTVTLQKRLTNRYL